MIIVHPPCCGTASRVRLLRQVSALLHQHVYRAVLIANMEVHRLQLQYKEWGDVAIAEYTSPCTSTLSVMPPPARVYHNMPWVTVDNMLIRVQITFNQGQPE